MPQEHSLEEFQALEQARAIYDLSPSILISTIPVWVLTALVLQPAFNGFHLLLWVLLGIAVITIRWLHVRRYAKREINAENHAAWVREFYILSAVSGLSWGTAWFFFVDPEQPIFVLFLVCVYTGYVASSISAIGFSLPVFFAFSISIGAPLILRSLFEGGYFFYSIAIMTLFYNLALLQFSRKSQDVFNGRSRLNFENRRLVEEVKLQKEKVEMSLRAKDSFLAAASHDLRQPLHSLGMFIDILRDRVSDQELQTLITKISQSTQALNELLHSLLDISRFDANVVENRPQPMDMVPILERVVKDYEALASDSNTELKLEIQNPSEGELIVDFDVVLMERLIRNLIDNAVKFTKDGVVHVCAKQAKGNIRIRIQDSGVGIPAEATEKIFTEFTQLENPERDRQKGLGLGLAIVQRLCKLTGLDLKMQSAIGVGTTFEFVLPVSSAPAETVNTPKKVRINGARIALVDDELDVLDGVSMILHNAGATVVAATGREQAIEKLHAADIEPDLIVADFRLRGGENGLDVVQAIRDEFNCDMPAVIVTGDTSPDRIALANASGIPFLHKPVSPQDLLAKVEELLSALS